MRHFSPICTPCPINRTRLDASLRADPRTRFNDRASFDRQRRHPEWHPASPPLLGARRLRAPAGRAISPPGQTRAADCRTQQYTCRADKSPQRQAQHNHACFARKGFQQTRGRVVGEHHIERVGALRTGSPHPPSTPDRPAPTLPPSRSISSLSVMCVSPGSG